MNKHPNLIWITGLVLGWLFDLLFWKQPFGINFALYSTLCLLGGALVLSANKQYPAPGAIALFPLILGFAAITAIRTEPLTAFLAVCFTLLFMAILSNTYSGGRWLWYGLGDYLGAGLRLIASMVARPVTFSAEVRKDQLEAGVVRKRRNFWPILRGIAISLPVLMIFASLLAAADAEFSRLLQDLLKLFYIENLPQYIFRMAYILIGAYLLVGVILHASTQSQDERAGDRKRLVPPFLGFTEAAIVLGSVTLLFAAFVVVQIRYFFGGQANITVAGFTYAEYARRGFGELVVVAFFSLLMILGLDAITRQEDARRRRVFSGLSVAIVAMVMVILVSAYERLALYESAYGFSRLRMYTHVALVWIGLLLVAVAVLEVIQRQWAFVPAMLAAGLGFALTLAILNVDALIVEQNAQRALRGQKLDVSYLAQLSTDAVPSLVDIFEDPAAPNGVREAAGAALACREQASPNRLSEDWRAFTFSGWQADLALKRVGAGLAGYNFLTDGYPTRVVTPGGTTYDCYGSGMD